MKRSGDRPHIGISAMARGKSPWGGKRGGDIAEDERDPDTAPEDENADSEPAADQAPFNPWLPPAEAGETRRSPRMEDILKQRRGASGGGGFPGLPGREQARAILPWVLAGTVLALALSTSLHVLDQGQSGIVTTLGRYNRSLGPGTHLTLPWPLEVVSLHGGKGAEMLTLPDGDGDMLLLTRDGELIDLAFQLRWRVSDPRRFAAAFADPDATIRALALAEVRAAVAEIPFDELWGGSRQAELQQRAAGRIQRALDAMRGGIKVEGVEVTRVNPPARLAEAFKRVANERAEAARVRKEAETWAAKTLVNARNEATDFNKAYEQYKLAPQVIRKRMYYETLERVLRNNQHIVVGGGAVTIDQPGTAARPVTLQAEGQ